MPLLCFSASTPRRAASWGLIFTASASLPSALCALHHLACSLPHPTPPPPPPPPTPSCRSAAPCLCRDGQGKLLANPPLIRAITKDPVLSKVKLISEPWDIGAYMVGWQWLALTGLGGGGHQCIRLGGCAGA